jgi:hypothetical protein
LRQEARTDCSAYAAAGASHKGDLPVQAVH